MFIAINGQLGSGKSELCKRLNSEYGFEIFHTGRIQREFAAELGISTLELNERCKQDHHYDKIIDSRLVEHAEKMRGKNVVFDSRMAWHFVKGAFKVHLLVAPDIAADRVFFHRVAEEERYSSKEEAMKNLMERRRLENERYKVLYNVSMSDYKNYDLILDTSLLTVKEELELIVGASEKYSVTHEFQGFYSAPTSLYPTECLLKNPLGAVSAVKKGESLYAVGGYRKLLEAARRGARILPIDYLGAEGEKLPDGNFVDCVAQTTGELVSEFEEAAGLRYGYIPE